MTGATVAGQNCSAPPLRTPLHEPSRRRARPAQWSGTASRRLSNQKSPERDDESSIRHSLQVFAGKHDLLRKTGTHVSGSCSAFLLKYDLFRKPVSTFRDHA